MIKSTFYTAKSITGKSHLTNGKPNQDSLYAELVENNHLIAVVADGHGSPKCFRSHKGSLFAVESFVEVIKKLDAKFKDIEVASEFEKNIPIQVVELWKEKVRKDIDLFPYASFELNEDLQNNEFLPYGSTLLGCYIHSQFGVFIQIGDGEMFALFNTGETKQIVEKDNRLNGIETTSICSVGAENDFRTKVMEFSLENYPKLIIMGSDGLTESYASNVELYKWCDDLNDFLLTDGSEFIEKNLPQWLDEVSTNGTCDDISLVAIGLDYNVQSEAQNSIPDIESEHGVEVKKYKNIFTKTIGKVFSINHKITLL